MIIDHRLVKEIDCVFQRSIRCFFSDTWSLIADTELPTQINVLSVTGYNFREKMWPAVAGKKTPKLDFQQAVNKILAAADVWQQSFVKSTKSFTTSSQIQGPPSLLTALKVQGLWWFRLRLAKYLRPHLQCCTTIVVFEIHTKITKQCYLSGVIRLRFRILRISKVQIPIWKTICSRFSLNLWLHIHQTFQEETD